MLVYFMQKMICGLLFCLLGCGSQAMASLQTPSPEACAGKAFLGNRSNGEPQCWELAGSKWHIIADGPGGKHDFMVELLLHGRVRSTDHPTASASSDEWVIQDGILRLFLSERFVEYRAQISNASVVAGRALNSRGHEWLWRGERLSAEVQCQDDELQVGEACMTVAGTTWKNEQGQLWLFASQNELKMSAGPNKPLEGWGTWTQIKDKVKLEPKAGAALEITINAFGALESASTLMGALERVLRQP